MTSSVDRGILSQCLSAITGQCLELSIRNRRLYFSFFNDDVLGATILVVGQWYHVAFVYDYSLMQQSVYLNGILDGSTWGSARLAGPFKGTLVDTLIGRAPSGYYFKGDIDNLQVSKGAKTACQILNDATLTAYYSFDREIFNLDLSNNYINGYSSGLSTVSGRVHEAYSFQGTSAYFQSAAFTAYSSGETFSVALWVKPYSVHGGTLIHLSANANGAGIACFDLLGFSTTGELIANIYYNSACCGAFCPICHYSQSIGGPMMVINTWTHIVLTYSSTNGMALYTNGTLRVFDDAFTSFHTNTHAFTTRPYMTVGNPSTTGSIPTGCLVATPTLSPGPYQGLIDDLRIYSRELTITEICSLFNP